jgi:hypothetical protein
MNARQTCPNHARNAAHAWEHLTMAFQEKLEHWAARAATASPGGQELQVVSTVPQGLCFARRRGVKYS